jgi:hypothetical protein
MPAPPVEVAGGGCSQQLKITCYLLQMVEAVRTAAEWATVA